VTAAASPWRTRRDRPTDPVPFEHNCPTRPLARGTIVAPFPPHVQATNPRSPRWTVLAVLVALAGFIAACAAVL
jgi:hypothetical protein